MKGLDAIAGYEQELPEAAIRQQRILEEFLEEDEDTPVVVKKRPKRLDEDDYIDEDLDVDDTYDDFDDEETVEVTKPARVSPGRSYTQSVEAPTIENAIEAMEVDPVLLSTSFGKFKLPSRCVMQNEFSVAFFLSCDSDLELAMGAEFELSYRGKSYSVCYAGGTFSVSESSKFKLLTFMRQF